MHLAHRSSSQSYKKVFISNGAICNEVYKDLVEASSVYDLYSLPIIKPLLVDKIIEKLIMYEEIIIVEEHQLIGGLGAAIQEILYDSYSLSNISSLPKIHRIGIENTFQSVAGTQDFLRERAGLFNYRKYI